MRKKIISVIISIVVVVVVLYCATRLVMPKYATDIVEGNLIKEYYQEKNKDFDVVFFGDCEVYENFSPLKMWQEYGNILRTRDITRSMKSKVPGII